MSLTREDWNDISKLTITGEPGSKIIEVKILESFIGEKPYPVIVVYKNAFGDLKWSQYNIEGIYSGSKDNFQIVKVPEPQENRYLKPLLSIMKNSLPIKQIMMGWHSAWYLITEVDNNNQVFHTRKSMMNFSDIETFVILVNNQEMSFKDFADSRPMSLKDILNSTTKE